MKFDPLFKSEENKLVKIDSGEIYSTGNLHLVYGENIGDASLPNSKKQLVAVKVKWSAVELQPGAYNEEFLAALRDYLKILENNGYFAFVIPETVKELPDADTVQSYIDAMVHCARRIKDCVSVIGFAIPAELIKKDSDFGVNSYAQWFINEMQVKHGHYLYFADKSVVEEKGLVDALKTSDLVTYAK
ncbi:MAG: hypothetical protein K6F15_04920 [Treponema sp.]|nr:hypothetical protein [Treponema sp.]